MNVGDVIASCRILEKLGEGGMGQVYRARDPKLNRDVAIKVLPDLFASDPDRLARFQREAQVLASLNHPNIAHIHGFEDSNGVRALVMELVEGEDLSQRIARGPIPLDEALPIARQIAEALEAAHDQGIVHRDLKPANIKVRPDGTVKVLDFGLAKALAGSSGSSGSSGSTGSKSFADSPTITSPAMTQAGIILGTAAYMAPEQAKGKPVDRRADIWAFGCVLFEMLTGRRAFDGEDIADVLSRVLQREPDWSALPATVGTHVQTLLQRCLDKDPRKRLPHMSVVGFTLDYPAQEVGAADSGLRSGSRARLPVAIAGVIAAGALGFIAATYRAPQAELPFVRSQIAVPDTSLSQIFLDGIAISPDGRRVAIVYPGASGRQILWIRALSALNAQPVAGTEGARAPFWSPDGSALAFSADSSGLKRVDIASGAVTTLAEVGSGSGGDWHADGGILFGTSSGIRRVSAAGGEHAAVPGTTRYYPAFLPDGKHYLHTVGRKVYLGSLESADHPVLLEDAGNAKYANGHIFFVRETTLYAQPFDPGRLALSGRAVVVAERIRISTGSGAGTFSVSPGGVLAYVTNPTTMSRLTWFDRSGREVGTLGETGAFSSHHLSRDGQWVTASISGSSDDTRDIWLFDTRRGIRTRVTRDDADDTDPAVSPDGSLIAYSARTGASKGLDVRAVTGSRPPARLTEDGLNKWPQDWSPDGRHVLYAFFSGVTRGGSSVDLWTVEADGRGKPVPIVQTSGGEFRGAFSPDGKWIAYESNDSDRFEIFVTPFPAGGAGRQVTSEGGANPHWGPDGRELFFLKGSVLMRAAVTGSPSGLDVGNAEPLFDLSSRLGDVTQFASGSNVYSVSPDGQRFLFAVPQRPAPEMISLVVNWQALVGGATR